MKVLVAVKRVIDFQVKVRVKEDHSGVVTNGVKMSMNPFDEIAVEEALRLKEKGICDEIILVSVGDDASQETLRNGLALGADRAILVKTANPLEPLNVAKVLHKIVQEENPGLILLGKQAIDDDCNQVGQMLAALAGYSQATNASRIFISADKCEVTREVDAGLVTVMLTLPAVVTTDLRLNEPRYPSLPNIMKAKSKPLLVKNLEDLHLQLKDHVKTLSVTRPPERKAGVKVDNIKQLLANLKEQGVLS